MSNELVHVVYASDGRDARRMSMSMYSVVKHLPDTHVKFIVLTAADPYPLSSKFDITYIDPTNQLSTMGFHPNGWNRPWPYSTLHRLAIPLLPELSAVDRVLYLDTDTLVRSEELQAVFSMELSEDEAYGATDVGYLQHRIRHVSTHDLSPDAYAAMKALIWDKRGTLLNTYMNAGVTLWNLSRIRKNGLAWYKCRAQWFWESETRGGFRYLDQDFLNVMLEACPKFNTRMDWISDDPKANCIVQHFTGPKKAAMDSIAASMGWSDEINA